MSSQRQDRLVDLLVHADGWRTASELADRLGVTSRSIRSYVAAVNRNVDAIESGPLGYRIRTERVAQLRQVAPDATPEVRRRAVGRTLAMSSDRVDVYELAQQHFVSDATIEADLAWVRARAVKKGLRWDRRGAMVGFSGAESARRSLLRELIASEAAAGYDETVTEVMFGGGTVEQIRTLRSRLSAAFTNAGFYVNEFALAGVAFSTIVAIWRSRQGAVVEMPEESSATIDTVAPVVTDIVEQLFGDHLPEAEARAIGVQLQVRGAIAGGTLPNEPADSGDDARIASELRTLVDQVTTRFGVPRLDEDVLARLVSHVQNLRRRSTGGEWSRNPLTRTLKSSYPLLFDVAVALGTGLYELFGIPVHDDEVAYLAMHIGGQWERQKALQNRITVRLVCPGYYEMHEMLRSSIEQSLGSVLVITEVHTDVEPATAATTDLVLTTIETDEASEHVVQISPFFTDVDAERVMAAVARIRRGRRLSQFRRELARYFVPTAFVRGIPASASSEDVIRQLGDLLVAEGVIDQAYVDSAVSRERASSTAFTETLAVPHAIGMTATRTAIAIGIAESSLKWGEGRVQVVALVGFSESDREAFQTVFEQFVEVFADPASVQTLVRRGKDFPTFLEQLAALIDG